MATPHLSSTISPKSFDRIAAEIQGHVTKFKRSGPHKAIFCCPAHEDKNPSAWIAQDEKGWTHAHCSVCGNLRTHFNALGVFFSEGFQAGPRKEKDRSKEWYDALRKSQKKNTPENFTNRQLGVLYFGEPDNPLDQGVFPLAGGKIWEKRLDHARQHPPMQTPFSAPYTAEGMEKTRAIALHYWQHIRGIRHIPNSLLFSHTSIDNKLGQEKRALLEKQVKAVIITPLKNPDKFHERAWQETWLDADGRKICRHFPTGVSQKGRVFYSPHPQKSARTLIIGEGLESTCSTPWHEPADYLAVLSLNGFSALNFPKKHYDRIILAPDLEPHQKGLNAVLKMAGNWLSSVLMVEKTVQKKVTELVLLRPDGKAIHDPVTTKKDMNDLTDNEKSTLTPIILTPENVLPDHHPVRQWSLQSPDALQQAFQDDLTTHLQTPGSGQRRIHALGTGVGKSHAATVAVAQATRSTLACAPTREGRQSLAEMLNPDTQEHHGRGETLPTMMHPDDLNDAEIQHYCPIWNQQGTENAAMRLQEVRQFPSPADKPLSPQVLGILGHPIAPSCNTVCPHGKATLFHITQGKKGEDTGADLCVHQMKRLEHWYQENQIASTHAGLNGDENLFKQDGKLREKIIIDESPELLDHHSWNDKDLTSLHMSLVANAHTDQRFYTGPDRDERLAAYDAMLPWIMHLQSALVNGWEDGDIPPVTGLDWKDFHDLVERWKHQGYVTIFERAYRQPDMDPTQKYHGPVFLDRLSKAIQNGTLYHGRHPKNQQPFMIGVLPTNIGQALLHTSKKQDIDILTATPSRALIALCGEPVTQAYPATPNLNICQIRGRNWSATALRLKREDTLRDLTDILDSQEDGAVILTTKAYEDALETSAFSHLTIGHWNRDHEGHNRYKDATHLEDIGLQMLPRETYRLMFEAIRKIYHMPWQPAKKDNPWVLQSIGLDYLPGSEISIELPDNPDFAYFIREYHTIEMVQAIGRLRAARRPDEKLTVTIRANFPFLPLFGLYISSVEGHSHRQEQVHDRAIEKTKACIQAVLDSGMRITFRNVNEKARELTGKGVKHHNWKTVVDFLTKDTFSPEENMLPDECVLTVEEAWKLRHSEAIKAEARRRGDILRRREAAMPGRGDVDDALLDMITVMDREHCNSAMAAHYLLDHLDKNRHHPGERYWQSLEDAILHEIPPNFWRENEAA